MAAAELNNTVLKDNANLKAYYRFESGALTTDSSGGGFTLTNNNTATETAGKYGGGAAFNGSNQSLTIANDFGIGATNWTISAWIKPSSSSQVGGVVAVGNGASNGFSIYQGNNGGGLAGNYIDGHLHGTTWLPSGVLWTGTAYDHVVMTRDTTTARIYVNGVHMNSTTTAPNAPNDVFEIGKMGAGYWAGSVDDVAIFSSALSADQIKELYEGRFIGEAYPQSGLVAGYHFNGRSTDFSGNNNHGTDTSITYSQANGRFGKGAGFDANTDQIVFQARIMPLGAKSLAFWLKTTGTATLSVLFDGCAVNGGNHGDLIWSKDTTGKIYFESYKGGGGARYSVVNSKAINDGVWHHIGLTWDGTTNAGMVKYYIDGNLDASGTANATETTTQAKNLTIGYPGGATIGIIFSLDEVLVFNRALTAQEIRRMYAVGTGKLQ